MLHITLHKNSGAFFATVLLQIPLLCVGTSCVSVSSMDGLGVALVHCFALGRDLHCWLLSWLRVRVARCRSFWLLFVGGLNFACIALSCFGGVLIRVLVFRVKI
jgi:hypothetical protein